MRGLQIFCIILFFEDILGEDVVVCSGISNPVTTIDCGPDAIIQVDHITAAYIINRGSCDHTHVLGQIATKVERCKTSVHRRVGCHGSHQCPVSHNAGATYLRHCGGTSNVLHIRYSCLQLDRTLTALLPLYEDVTARNLHVFSPGFPSTMPNDPFTFSCQITPAGLDADTVAHMEVMMERLRFYKTNQCTQRLYFVVDDQNRSSFCSNAQSDLWKAELNFSAQTLKFVYEQVNDATDPTDYGGLFWLHVTGYQPQGPLDLSITCPDQSQIPGYTTTPKSTTTTTTTTTVATPADIHPKPTITTTTTTTVATQADIQQETTEGQDEASEEGETNNSTWYGVTGGSLCLVPIAVAVSVFLSFQ